jgi:molybdopterin molybdotransferase
MSAPPLAVADARRAVLREVVPSGLEAVPLDRCLDRVAAAPALAAGPVPPFDNSAMDGFALRASDLAAGRPLRLVGESRAGRPAAVAVGEGEALRISTGAAMPAGADTVLPVERASEADGTVAVAEPVAPGAHVRRAGEDIRPGQELIAAGTAIGPAELGVLAAAGVATVECARRPRLEILTTGDELRAPGEPLAPGQIHDSNRFTLAALASRAGAEPCYGGALADDLEATVAAIEPRLGADLLVIAGGVSVGRHDHVKEALRRLGVAEVFWRVAMRPGAPTWFGVLRREGGERPTLVLGLPGNPVSAMVTFQLFARAAVLAATGRDPEPERVLATLTSGHRKAPGRTQFLRCRLARGEAGWEATPTGPGQGSHVLSSMVGAAGLAALPAAADRVDRGATVEVWLL